MALVTSGLMEKAFYIFYALLESALAILIVRLLLRHRFSIFPRPSLGAPPPTEAPLVKRPGPPGQ